MDSLANGLRRVDPLAAEQVRNGAIKILLAYYGDINNQLMTEAGDISASGLTGQNDPHFEFVPCLPEAPLRKALNQLTSIQDYDGEAYGALLSYYNDSRWMDEIARSVSWLAETTALSEYVVKWATADMSEYLHTRKTGSEVRQRLQSHLRPALEQDENICLISHSMGAIVAYDVLWKYSHMSEYRHIQERGSRVSLWLTIGCPLGEAGVRQNLYDAHERGEDRFPRHIVREWVNIAAEDDFVAHDRTMADDFRDMRKLNFVDRIIDRTIYNFWVKDETLDPHNFYGYLDNPCVAGHIANWITKRSGDGRVYAPPASGRSPYDRELAAA